MKVKTLANAGEVSSSIGEPSADVEGGSSCVGEYSDYAGGTFSPCR